MTLGKARALLIGINYVDSPHGRLNGCVNDVKNVKAFLQTKLGMAESDIAMYHDLDENLKRHTTGQGILTALTKVITDSWKDDLDFVWIHYSGHGTHIRDGTDKDEKDGQDEALVPSDYSRAGIILDDTLHSMFKRFNPKTRVFCVFDACHSGTIADLKYLFLDENRVQTEHEDSKPVTCKATSLSGCMDNQTSADAYGVLARKEYTGALTSCLLQSLETDFDACRNDIFKLLANVRELLKQKRFDQFPQLSASYDVRDARVAF